MKLHTISEVTVADTDQVLGQIRQITPFKQIIDKLQTVIFGKPVDRPNLYKILADIRKLNPREQQKMFEKMDQETKDRLFQIIEQEKGRQTNPTSDNDGNPST